jgi:dTDP-4-dehydrorhamnose reductase
MVEKDQERGIHELLRKTVWAESLLSSHWEVERKTKMKILLTGSKGQLGTDLVKVLKEDEVIPLTHADVDITDFNSFKAICVNHKPDVIINTAAYVRVDDCETNQELAYKVNTLGVRNAAVVAEDLGAKLVHLSTDYVFGGEIPSSDIRTTPYTEFDEPAPLNVYGKSKLAGEEFVRHLCHRYFIVRASGLFGVAGSSGKGGNFIETILRLAKERDKLTVVDDQIFSPTYTPDLADKIAHLMKTELYGIYHITNSGSCSWYEFAREALKLTGSRTTILPIKSDQYHQKAKRPKYSVLGHFGLKLIHMNEIRNWKEGLNAYLDGRNQDIKK